MTGSKVKVSWSGHIRGVIPASFSSSSGEDEAPITLREVCEEVNKKQISLKVIGALFPVDWAGKSEMHLYEIVNNYQYHLTLQELLS